MLFCSNPSSVFRLGILLISLVHAPAAIAAEPPPFPPLPSPPSPLANVADYAQRNQIPLASVQPMRDRAALPGDLTVLLITLFEGTAQKQWLLELTVAEPKPEERPTKFPPKTVLYVTTGTRLEYSYSPVTFALKTHGPFVASTAPKTAHTTSARTVVNADDLQLGFDATSRFMERIRNNLVKEGDRRPFGLSFQTTPYPADLVAKMKLRAEELGITTVDERALAGSAPALMSFFRIAESTAGLRDIIWEIIDLPSAWSVVKRGGRVDPYFNMDGNLMRKLETAEGEPSRAVFVASLQLNGQPALKAQLIVTKPKPPFLNTAGILEIYAEHPTKPEKHAVVQVLATRLAEEKK